MRSMRDLIGSCGWGGSISLGLLDESLEVVSD